MKKKQIDMDTHVHLSLPFPEAVSTASPTKEELFETARLQAFVDEASPLVTAGAAARQKCALKRLYSLFKTWANQPVHVFVSGSYRLGVHSSDADIDVIFVTTRHIARERVFREFVPILAREEGIEDLQPIPNARVPIIGLALDGQEFDVLTCHLREAELPSREAMLNSYEWMNGLDEASILAFNGPRVTEMLLRSVPDAGTFLLTLRYLRLWAKRRAIYSNKSGYLGGINVALLTCYVAQRFPTATASVLILRFFELFSQWTWTKRNPVRLDSAVEQKCPVWLQSHEWSPRVTEIMVVLTPCFPRFNSTFSASMYSCRVIQRELRRGHVLLEEAPGNFEKIAGALPLLATCRRFLRVSVTAPDTPDGRAWQGYIESQTRFLILYLSREELAVKEFRYIPTWATVQTPTSRLRMTYITAEDDGKIRTYVIRGSLARPLDYFKRMHAEAGPPMPPSAAIDIAYIAQGEIPADLLESVPNIAEEDSYDTPRRTKVKPSIDTGLSPKRKNESIDYSMYMGPSRKLLKTQLASRKMKIMMKRDKTLPSRIPKVIRIIKLRGRVVAESDVYIGNARFDCGWQLPAAHPDLRCSIKRADYDDDDAWLAAYRKDVTTRLLSSPSLRRSIANLEGKTLGCWCKPQACHGDVLVELFRKIKPNVK